MKRLLIALHVGLIATVMVPVWPRYPEADLPNRWYPWKYQYPLMQALDAAQGWPFWNPSVVAAGLPGFLAALNLPLFFLLRGPAAERWRAFSSLVLGLLSTSMMAQLLARYGEGRDWGGWVTWSLSLLLTIAGLVACVRLSPTDSQFAIRDSEPRPQ